MDNSSKRNSGFSLNLQEYIICSVLSGSPRYPYQIHKDIMNKTDKQIKISASALGAILRRLLKAGFVSLYPTSLVFSYNHPIKSYILTDAGMSAFITQSRLLSLFQYGNNIIHR